MSSWLKERDVYNSFEKWISIDNTFAKIKIGANESYILYDCESLNTICSTSIGLKGGESKIGEGIESINLVQFDRRATGVATINTEGFVREGLIYLL